MSYTVTTKVEAYATESGPVIKKSMISLPECTIDPTEPSTRVEFMVAMLANSDNWCLFYNRGGDWNVFEDGAEHDAERLEAWMPDGVSACVTAVSARIGESADDDMDWFSSWAGNAQDTLDNASTKVNTLQSAIEATDTSGFPGAWSVDQREDGDILLIWTAGEKDVTGMDGDEPWVKGGGREIIKAAGIGDYNDHQSGADAYQDKYGDNVVTQWVCFKK